MRYLFAAAVVLVLGSCGKRARELAAESEEKAAAASSSAEERLGERPEIAAVEPDGEGGADPLSALPRNVPPKYAEVVPGKHGLVYSPYAKGKEVDVAGLKPGTEVRCPYSQRVFLVP